MKKMILATLAMAVDAVLIVSETRKAIDKSFASVTHA